MNNDIEISVRSPAAYALAGEALRMMQDHGVWPTPLNYELWLYVAGDPESPLAQEPLPKRFRKAWPVSSLPA